MITQARLKELFSYDPTTGIFTSFLRRPGRKTSSGGVGSPHAEGYSSTMIDGSNYLLHRLAWLYVHGSLPPGDIDHIDGNRANNALANLRLADRFENCQNSAVRSDNKTGCAGVFWAGKRWRARITVKGVHHHVGYFDRMEDAVSAYLKAKSRLHTFQPVPRGLL